MTPPISRLSIPATNYIESASGTHNEGTSSDVEQGSEYPSFYKIHDNPEILLKVMGFSQGKDFRSMRVTSRNLRQAGYSLINHLSIGYPEHLQKAGHVFGDKKDLGVKPGYLQEAIDIFGNKNNLGITFGDSSKCTRADLEKLPRSLKHLHLHSCRSLTADDFVFLMEHCTELEELTITNSNQVTDNVLEKIGQSKLRCLKLFSRGFTATGLLCLGQLNSLEELTLHCTDQLTDAVLEQIGMRSKLRRLELAVCSGFTTDGLLYLGKLENLEKLVLSSIKLLTDTVLNQLGKKLLNLKILSIGGGTEFTADGLVSILKFKLEDVYLTEINQMTDAVLKQLGQLVNLWRLRISRSSGFTTDGLVSMLKELKNSKVEELALCGISGLLKDEALEQLENLNLRRLALAESSGFTPASFASMKEKLNKVEFSGKYSWLQW